jgi:curved DNA-binding protein CbpA
MPVKDYYKLLKIAHSADLNTIKKAYRQLAMQYHPDKHGNNQSTHFYFQEIQEAYEVLSSPEKRENYHYQIWLEKAQGHELDTALSADQIIQLFIHTERTIHETDSFRRNNEQLTEILVSLYSNTRLELIAETNDKSLETTTLQLAMQSSSSLSSDAQFKMIHQLNPILKKNPQMHETWMKQVNTSMRKEKIEKFKVPIVILTTILLCLAILLLSK